MADHELSKDERNHIAHLIQDHMRDELDQDIGNMEATLLLDRLIGPLGDTFYNKGLRDAAALFSRRADDMADELYTMEKITKTDR